MAPIQISHTGYWVYSMPHAGFLSVLDGGWGAKNWAGGDASLPAFSIKVALGGYEVADDGAAICRASVLSSLPQQATLHIFATALPLISDDWSAVERMAWIEDLDVQGDAALKHIKLWKCMDATCEDVHDVAYGVVSYPVGPDRGMPGARRMTWNGSAVAIAKRRPCAPDFRRLKRRLIVAHGEAGRWSIGG